MERTAYVLMAACLVKAFCVKNYLRLKADEGGYLQRCQACVDPSDTSETDSNIVVVSTDDSPSTLGYQVFDFVALANDKVGA